MNTNYTQEQRYLTAKKRVEKIKGFYYHLSVYVVINIFISSVIIFGLMENDKLTFAQTLNHLGTYITWLTWGIGIFFHWLGVFGFPSLISKKWEEQKIQEILNQDQKRFDEISKNL